MGNNTNPRVIFNCDYCKKESSDRPSHYARKIRHFCSMKCYADFQREFLSKEEHNSLGHGNSPEERLKRRKARSKLNHFLRDKRIQRPNCELCNDKAEAHHDDYNKPLDVRWLCFNHHHEYHKSIYENPELLN